MTKTNVTPQDAPTLASDAELAAHAADSTAVHGIADTSLLSTTAHDHDADYEAAGGIATHSADSTAVHGITDTAALVVDGDAAGGELAGTYPNPTVASSHAGSTHDAAAAAAVATHEADTTNVHAHTSLSAVGIDDHHARDHAINAAVHTGTLDDAQIPAGIARDAEVTAAIATHEGLTDPHTGYVREADASWVDLTDGGATTLHSHAGGAGATGGTAILDFGAFPGATDASIAVTGQAAIVAGSLVEARMRLVATATHSADEHWVEGIVLNAGSIVAGTGFTIYGRTGDKTRRYGTWTIAWTWQ